MRQARGNVDALDALAPHAPDQAQTPHRQGAQHHPVAVLLHLLRVHMLPCMMVLLLGPQLVLVLGLGVPHDAVHDHAHARAPCRAMLSCHRLFAALLQAIQLPHARRFCHVLHVCVCVAKHAPHLAMLLALQLRHVRHARRDARAFASHRHVCCAVRVRCAVCLCSVPIASPILVLGVGAIVWLLLPPAPRLLEVAMARCESGMCDRMCSCV